MAPPISTLGLQKAAILMVLLGEESASHIYRNLPEGDVERLTRRIAELEHFKPETAMSVLEEYYQLTLTQGYLAEGGPDYAQKLLVKAFGEAGAQRPAYRAVVPWRRDDGQFCMSRAMRRLNSR